MRVAAGELIAPYEQPAGVSSLRAERSGFLMPASENDSKFSFEGELDADADVAGLRVAEDEIEFHRY